jgi:hypothetical protein
MNFVKQGHSMDGSLWKAIHIPAAGAGEVRLSDRPGMDFLP